MEVCESTSVRSGENHPAEITAGISLKGSALPAESDARVAKLVEILSQSPDDLLVGLLEEGPYYNEFRSAYEHLHRGMKEAHEDQLQGSDYLETLQKYMVGSRTKADEALKATQNNQLILVALQKELGRATDAVADLQRLEEGHRQKSSLMKQDIRRLIEMAEKETRKNIDAEKAKMEDDRMALNSRAQLETLEAELEAHKERHRALCQQRQGELLKLESVHPLVASLESQVEEVEARISATQVQSEAHKKEHSEKGERIEEQTQAVERLQQIKEDLPESLKHARTDLQGLRTQLGHLEKLEKKSQADISRLKYGLQDLETRHQLMQGLSVKYAQEIFEVEHLNSGLKKESDELHLQVEAEKPRSAESISRLSQLTQQNQGYQEDLDRLHASRLEEERESQKKQGQLTSLETKFEIMARNLEKKMNESKMNAADLQELEAQIWTTKREIDKVNKDCLKNEAVIEWLGTQQAQLQEDIQCSKDLHTQTLQEVNLAVQQVDCLNKDLVLNESELLVLTQANEAALYEKKQFVNQVLDLTEVLAQTRDQHTLVVQELADLRHQMADLQDQRQQTEAEEHTQVKLIQVDKEHIQLMGRQKKALCQTLTKSHKKREEIQAQHREMQAQEAAVLKEIELAPTQIENLIHQVHQKKEEIEQLNQELANLSEKNRDKQVETQNLQGDIRTKQAQFQKLRAKTQTVQKKFQELRGLERQLQRLAKLQLQEDFRVRALTDELGRPVNRHGWRALEDEDPATFRAFRQLQDMKVEYLKFDRICRKRRRALNAIQDTQVLALKRMNGYPSISMDMLASVRADFSEKSARLRVLREELEMKLMANEEVSQAIKTLNTETAKLKAQYRELCQEDIKKPKLPTKPLKPSLQIAGGGFVFGTKLF